MPKPIKWGILGAAAIADGAIIPAIAASGNSSVLAIASRDVERARVMAGKHGIDKVHATYADLCADTNVDAVYVALPNSLHSEWSIRALEAGKHVLCEKPLAVTVLEGERMAMAAKLANRLLMEAFMYRFSPRIERFRASVHGLPLHVHSAFAYPTTERGNIRLSEALGGGALMDLGCYAVSVARLFLGEPVQVKAFANVIGVDRSVSAALLFPARGLATIWASFEAPEHQHLTVITSEGVFHFEGRPFGAWYDPQQPERLAPYVEMVQAFSKSVLTQSPVPLSVEDSLNNLRVIEEIRRSAGFSPT